MPVPGAEGPTLSAEEPTLSSESHTGRTGVLRIPAPAGPSRPAPLLPGLDRFNTAPSGAAEAALLACCGSRRWGRRIVAHRPYPDLDALLAAADEAGYDLGTADLDEALRDECSPALHPGAPAAAHTALRAALSAYESRFGHAFAISLDGFHPDEQPDQVLAAIRSRLGNDPDEERVVAADELRRLARARLAHLVADRPEEPEPAPIARPCLFDHT